LTTENLRMLEERRPDPDEVSHIMPQAAQQVSPNGKCQNAQLLYHQCRIPFQSMGNNKQRHLLVATSGRPQYGYALGYRRGLFQTMPGSSFLIQHSRRISAKWVQKERVTPLSPSVPALITRVLNMEVLRSMISLP